MVRLLLSFPVSDPSSADRLLSPTHLNGDDGSDEDPREGRSRRNSRRRREVMAGGGSNLVRSLGSFWRFLSKTDGQEVNPEKQRQKEISKLVRSFLKIDFVTTRFAKPNHKPNQPGCNLKISNTKYTQSENIK